MCGNLRNSKGLCWPVAEACFRFLDLSLPCWPVWQELSAFLSLPKRREL